MARRSRNISAYGSGPTPTKYPLDDYPGALMGVSLRKLSSTYNGPCVEVSDPLGIFTQDVGFDGDFVDNAELLSLAAGGDLVVRSWYTQTGGSALFRRASASQRPYIVRGGSLSEYNGLQGIEIDSGLFFFATISYPELNSDRLAVELAFSRVTTSGTTSNLEISYGGTNSRLRLRSEGGQNFSFQARVNSIDYDLNWSSALTLPSSILESVGFTASEVYAQLNNETRITDANTIGTIPDTHSSLRMQAAEAINCFYHEMLLYPTEQAGLRQDINEYWNLF